MGLFIPLICICLITYVGFFLGLKFYPRLKWKYPSELVETTILYVSFLISSGIACCLSFVPLSWFFVLNLGALTVLGIKLLSFSKRWKWGLSFLLCLVSVLCLYDDSILSVFFLTLFWGIAWGIFFFFDRFPLVSSLVSVCWTFGIVFVGLVMRGIPEMIIFQTALFGGCIAIFSRFKLLQKNPRLGCLPALMGGFIWAGLWTYFISKGAVIQTLVSFGYYLFEAVFLIGAFVLHRPLTTLLEQLLARSQFSSKATNIVFTHTLALSFLSIMSMQMNQSTAPLLLIALGIILIDLYMRLNALEHPIPTWREMFKDTKESVMLLVDEVKSKNTASKEEAKTSKKVPIKKTSSKKSVKKKTVQKRKTKK